MSPLNGGMGSASGDVLELDIGYAKLQGKKFDYCIQFYEIILGRNTKKEKVDLDLSVVGEAKDISRRHARIYYDFKHQTFALEVLGKSGCYVERVLYLPGDGPVKLDSQDHIQIGGIELYFLESHSRPIDESIPARGTTYSYTFRGVKYHDDPATGVVEYTLPSEPMYATASAHRHSHILSQPMSTTASAQHTPIPSQPMAATASALHTHIPSQLVSTTASAQNTPIPSEPMSAIASAQHTHIPSQPMSSSSMLPVHPNFSALRGYNYGNSHGCANGDSGTAIITGTQGTFMKQSRSLVGLDLNLEPIIETLEEDAENAHGCANSDGGIIVGTGTQETNVEKNNRSFGELDLNVEPTETLNDDVENGHGLAKGDSGIIVSAGTQGTNMEQNNRSFGELDLNVEPIGALDEHENGHGLANGDSGIIVGTGTQGMNMEPNNRSFGDLSVEPIGTPNEHVESGHDLANGDSGIVVGTGTQRTFIEQINRSLVELNLNVEPMGTLGEHVDRVEIRTDKDTDNPQLRQKEENDLMSSVASIVSNHPSPNGWVPATEVHAELVKRFSKIWPSSKVQKYLASEAGSSTGAVEKPWQKLLELLRKCPEEFVTCSLSRGTETSDFVGFLHPPVLP